jgi:hypothetical protein
MTTNSGKPDRSIIGWGIFVFCWMDYDSPLFSGIIACVGPRFGSKQSGEAQILLDFIMGQRSIVTFR